ncbi:MAG: NAD(P)/FAD-dependent oxidoreductase [Deltaproteobacteria bacterium]|nr:NAD(P)/FAD-dependent oxidoreductase [Deltaproteobacteria bacterium]
MLKTDTHSVDILIVGGGTAGITVAASLAKRKIFSSITILEPSKVHYYQPLWTLVGAGIFPKESSEKREADLIPSGVDWIQDAAETFLPQTNRVITTTGREITYRYLVVCPGMEIFWDKIQGLKETLGTSGVVSNYSYNSVESTWRAIHQFKKGRAIFTFPNTPIKCGGAPQKIMYLAEDYFRKVHIRNECEVVFASAGNSIFGVKKYADALNVILKKRGIISWYRQNLIAIDAKNKQAIFKNLDTGEDTTLPFEMIHVTPPMGAPAFIKRSPLADSEGWISVDKFSLQHTKFSNVFGLGDASSLPTSRTGAAIRKQSPVLIENLISLFRDRPLTAKYQGYTSCPLVTRYGKVILAEFDYDGNRCETFPFDQSKERSSLYFFKKHILPLLYWEGMLKGRL